MIQALRIYVVQFCVDTLHVFDDVNMHIGHAVIGRDSNHARIVSVACTSSPARCLLDIWGRIYCYFRPKPKLIESAERAL